MKTHRIQFAAFCSCFLLLTSCNKDDSTPPASTQKNPIEQLRAFRQQIETFKGNPNLRSQETMPLDEALWDIENHFNLTYSDPEQYYAQTNKHEFTLTLPLPETWTYEINDPTSISFYNIAGKENNCGGHMMTLIALDPADTDRGSLRKGHPKSKTGAILR